jgi:sugar lactone lactonase YvrE
MYTYIVISMCCWQIGSVTTLVNSTAGLRTPTDIAFASSGVFYVSDTGNNVIRKVTSNGKMSILAGGLGVSGVVDGVGTVARFNSPTGITVDNLGIVYVADTGNNRIRKITSSGHVATFVGSSAGYHDGSGTNALFSEPFGVALDLTRNLYVTDNHAVVRYVDTAGKVTTLAGSTSLAQSLADGYGTSARFNDPRGIALDTVGLVYIVDLGNQRLRRLDLDGEVHTLAGNNLPDYIDGAATHASLNYPWGVVVSTDSDVYFTSTGYGIIRKVDTNGLVTTLAGSPDSDGSRDGLGVAALFEGPKGLTLDASGSLYVVGAAEQTVRKLTIHNASCSDGEYYTGHFCYPVSAGFYAPTDTASSDIVYACPPGTYSFPGSTSCIVAPSGNFTPTAGQSYFYPCPNNTYDAEGSAECFPISVQPTSFPTLEPRTLVQSESFSCSYVFGVDALTANVVRSRDANSSMLLVSFLHCVKHQLLHLLL